MQRVTNFFLGRSAGYTDQEALSHPPDEPRGSPLDPLTSQINARNITTNPPPPSPNERDIILQYPILSTFSNIPTDSLFQRYRNQLEAILQDQLSLENYRLHGFFDYQNPTTSLNGTTSTKANTPYPSMLKPLNMNEITSFMLINHKFPNFATCLTLINANLLSEQPHQISLDPHNDIFLHINGPHSEQSLDVIYTAPLKLNLKLAVENQVIDNLAMLDYKPRFQLIRELFVTILTQRKGQVTTEQIIQHLSDGVDLQQDHLETIASHFKSIPVNDLVTQSSTGLPPNQMTISEGNYFTKSRGANAVTAKYLPANWVKAIQNDTNMAKFIGLIDFFIAPKYVKSAAEPRFFSCYQHSDTVEPQETGRPIATLIQGVYQVFNDYRGLQAWQIDPRFTRAHAPGPVSLERLFQFVTVADAYIQDPILLTAENYPAVIHYISQRALSDLELARTQPARTQEILSTGLPYEIYQAASEYARQEMPAILMAAFQKYHQQHSCTIKNHYVQKISNRTLEDAHKEAIQQKLAAQQTAFEDQLSHHQLATGFACDPVISGYLPTHPPEKWQTYRGHAVTAHERVDFDFLLQVHQASMEQVFMLEHPSKSASDFKAMLENYLTNELDLYRQDVSSIQSLNMSKDNRCWLRAAWLSIIAGSDHCGERLNRFKLFFGSTYYDIGLWRWQLWMIQQEFQRARENLLAFMSEQRGNADQYPAYLGGTSMHDNPRYQPESEEIKSALGFTDEQIAGIRAGIEREDHSLAKWNLEGCLLEFTRAAIGLHAKRYRNSLWSLQQLDRNQRIEPEVASAIHATLGQDMLMIEVQREGQGETGNIMNIQCRIVTPTPGDITWQKRLTESPSQQAMNIGISPSEASSETTQLVGNALQTLEQKGIAALRMEPSHQNGYGDLKFILGLFKGKPVIWFEAQHYVVYLPKRFRPTTMNQASTSNQLNPANTPPVGSALTMSNPPAPNVDRNDLQTTVNGGMDDDEALDKAIASSLADTPSSAVPANTRQSATRTIPPPLPSRRRDENARLADVSDMRSATVSQQRTGGAQMAAMRSQAAQQRMPQIQRTQHQASRMAHNSSLPPPHAAYQAELAQLPPPTLSLDQRCEQWFIENQNLFMADSPLAYPDAFALAHQTNDWRWAQNFAQAINWNGIDDIPSLRRIAANYPLTRAFEQYIQNFRNHNLGAVFMNRQSIYR